MHCIQTKEETIDVFPRSRKTVHGSLYIRHVEGNNFSLTVIVSRFGTEIFTLVRVNGTHGVYQPGAYTDCWRAFPSHAATFQARSVQAKVSR